MVKIGVIAPFEGLYRQSGYAILNAVREGIADCSPDHIDVLPVALDDSAQTELAQRAAQKLIADPAVIAIIGPFSLDTLSATDSERTAGDPIWIVPTAVDSSGEFAVLNEGIDWLADLISAIEALAQTQGAEYLLVAGLPPSWEEDVMTRVSQNETHGAVRYVVPDDFDFSQMEPGGAFLWLGQPHLGVSVSAALHEAQADAAFWMGPSGEDPVFADRSSTIGPLYWASWVSPQYNSDSQQYAPDQLMESLTRAATCRALVEAFGTPDTTVEPLILRAFHVNLDGETGPVAGP